MCMPISSLCLHPYAIIRASHLAEPSVKGGRASDSLGNMAAARSRGRGHGQGAENGAIAPVYHKKQSSKVKRMCSLMVWLSC